MTRRLAFSAFGKGRLSPLMRGRIDTEMYYASAEELDNIVIRPQGIPVRRIGTYYVNDTNVSTYTRLIPFVVSVADSYIVESSDLSFKMRDSDGEPIELDLDSVAAYSGGTPYVGGDTVTDATDFYVCIQDHTTAEALTETDFWYQLDLADGLTGTWEVELTTPYTTAQLPDVDFAQKDDTLKFTYQLHDIGELRRYADNVWVFVQGEIFGPPWEDLNEDIDFDLNIVDRNVTGSNTKATSTKDLFNQADEDNGRYFRMDDANSLGEQGYFQVKTYTNPQEAQVEVIIEIQNSLRTTKWSRNAFYVGNYPKHITYHEGRLILANTPTDQQKVWFSKSFAYNDFNITNTDDGGFDFTLNTDESNEIQWLSSGEGLAIGTFGGEFIANSPSDGVLTNENKNVRRQSNWGSELVRPRKIGSKLYYVQRGSRKIREYFYERDFNNYDSKDITEYAEDITISGVRDMAYQRNPDSLLWCVLENGTGAVLSRSPDSELMAWTPWETQGTVTGIMFLPNPDGEVDRGFIVVQRVLPTGTRQYLEYFDSHVIEEDTDIRNDRIFLDSVGEYGQNPGEHTDTGPYHHHGQVDAIPATTGWPDLSQGNFSENVFWDSVTRNIYAVQTNSSTGQILMSIVEIDIDTWTITDTWTAANDAYWPQIYTPDWPTQDGRASYADGKLVVLTNKNIPPLAPSTGINRGLIALLYDMTAGTQTFLACDNYTFGGYNYTQNVEWDALHAQFNFRTWSASWVDSQERLWLFGINGGQSATLGYISLIPDLVATFPYTYTEVAFIDWTDPDWGTGDPFEIRSITTATTTCFDFDETNGKLLINGAGLSTGGDPKNGFMDVRNYPSGTDIIRYDGGTDDFPKYGLNAPSFYGGDIYGGVNEYDVTDAGKGLVKIVGSTGAVTFYEPDPTVFTAADDYGITGIVACENDYLAMNTNQGFGIFDTIGKTWQLIDNAEITGLTVTGSDTVFAWDVAFDAENNWVVASLSNFEGSGTGQGVVLIDVYRYTRRGLFDISHLEGLTVALMGDGDYLGDYLVTGGILPAYTFPQPLLDSYYVGLKYTSLIKTNPLNAQTPQGMAAGQIRGINEVAINLYRTREMEYGNDLTTLSPLGIPEGKSADATDADYTGVVPNMTFDGRLDYVAYIYLRQAKPYTMNILGIYPEVEIS